MSPGGSTRLAALPERVLRARPAAAPAMKSRRFIPAQPDGYVERFPTHPTARRGGGLFPAFGLALSVQVAFPSFQPLLERCLTHAGQCRSKSRDIRRLVSILPANKRPNDVPGLRMVHVSVCHINRHPVDNVEIHPVKCNLLRQVGELFVGHLRWGKPGSPRTKPPTDPPNTLSILSKHSVGGTVSKQEIEPATPGAHTRSFLRQKQAIICVEKGHARLCGTPELRGPGRPARLHGHLIRRYGHLKKVA